MTAEQARRFRDDVLNIVGQIPRGKVTTYGIIAAWTGWPSYSRMVGRTLGYMPEAACRAKKMVMRMEELGFGNCTNTRACEAVCPKNESIANIARLNREFIKAKLAD